MFTIYQCPTCNEITILKKSYEDVTLEDLKKDHDYVEKHQTTIYPRFNILDKNIIPSDIYNIYEEAMPLKKLSPNSFGMQIRKALELICDTNGAPESSQLYEKLEQLAQQGKFPKNIIDMGQIIRTVARYGCHPKDEEITEADADLLDDIFNLILEYIYITPYKIKLLEDKFKKQTCHKYN